MEEHASYISRNYRRGINQEPLSMEMYIFHMSYILFCSSFNVFLWSIVKKFSFLAKPNPSAMLASMACTQDGKVVIQFSMLNKITSVDL